MKPAERRLHHPAQDQRALAISDSHMFGPAFLVAPVTDPVDKTSGTREVYLPDGTDRINFWTGEKVAGGREITTPAPLETLPLFVRAGSIVPLGPVMQYATEKADAPYEIRVYPGADGRFTIYEDDNETYAYKKVPTPPFRSRGTSAAGNSPSARAPRPPVPAPRR